MHIEEKMDLILAKQVQLLDRVELFLPNLQSEKGVIHFLEITKNTFNTYLKNGVFLEGIHFEKVNKSRVFIPDEIVKLKQSGVKGKRSNSDKQDKVDAVQQQLGLL